MSKKKTNFKRPQRKGKHVFFQVPVTIKEQFWCATSPNTARSHRLQQQPSQKKCWDRYSLYFTNYRGVVVNCCLWRKINHPLPPVNPQEKWKGSWTTYNIRASLKGLQGSRLQAQDTWRAFISSHPIPCVVRHLLRDQETPPIPIRCSIVLLLNLISATVIII